MKEQRRRVPIGKGSGNFSRGCPLQSLRREKQKPGSRIRSFTLIPKAAVCRSGKCILMMKYE